MATKLYLLPQKGYNESLYKLLKSNIKEWPVCYVTLNKTAASIREGLTAHGIEHSQFFFLDSVTPKLFESVPEPGCVFLSDIENLNSLAEQIFTAVHRAKSKTLILDSLSSLIVSADQKKAILFLQYLMTLLSKMGCSVIFLGLNVDKDTPVIKQVQMIVDDYV